MTLESYLVGKKKKVYLYESQQFERFKYIRRCGHSCVSYLMSEQYAISSQSELQMFLLIAAGTKRCTKVVDGG